MKVSNSPAFTRDGATRSHSYDPPPALVIYVVTQVDKAAVCAAAAMAQGQLRVLKVPGAAAVSRAALVALVKANRSSLRELHAYSAAGDKGVWSPQQVHAAVAAAGEACSTSSTSSSSSSSTSSSNSSTSSTSLSSSSSCS